MALDLNITDTHAAAAAPGKSLTLPKWNRRKVSAKDRMFFTEQLSLLLATGTSLHPALHTIAAQVKGQPLEDVVEALAEGVMAGRALSEEMALQPEVFPPLYASLVAASERGGFLPEVLDQLREIEESNDALRSTLFGAFSYPAFLILFSIATMIFVLLVVFPKFADMFSAIGDDLPTTTKLLMSMSSFLINDWIWVLGGVSGIVAALVAWMKTPAGRDRIDGLKLTGPVVGGIFQRVYLVVLFRVLGLALSHGVSLVDAIRTSHTLFANHRVKAFLEDVSAVLEEGGRLSHGLSTVKWLPDLARQMLATGEESGSLAAVMQRMSDHYNRELNRALQQFSRLIEPVMLVVMGVMVGVLVSSLILPIFKLSNSVG